MGRLNDWLFSNGLGPLGFCYQWKPTFVWLHALSDMLIALSYFSIAVTLIYFVRKRRGAPLGWMFICVGIFIAACAATHVIDVWTLWVPLYRFSGGIKIITAIISVPMTIFLVRLLPTVLGLPSHDELNAANDQLKRQASTLRESEGRFQQIAQNIQEIFWVMNLESKEVTYVSAAFEQICELPLDTIYSNPKTYCDLIHPQDRQRVLVDIEKMESTNHLDEEFRIVCPSGTMKWIRAIGFTAKDPGGNVRTLIGTAQEVTARKEMEFALRESEDRYRDLVEHSTDLICTYTLEGRLLSFNELPAKLLGYSREELLNTPMRDFLLPEARAQFDESLVSVKRDGFVKGLMVVLTKTGERRVWEYHNTLRTEGVAVPIVRGIAHDVTDQRRMEKALRLSEEKFSKAFHSSPVEIVISTIEEGRFLDVNESFERNTGFTREEAIGHTALELGLWFKPDDRATVVEQIKKHGRVRNLEIRFRSKSGEKRVKLYSAEPIEIRGKHCLLVVCEDITLRKHVEEELRFSEEKFSKAFRCSPTVVSISTLEEGRFLEVNEAFERNTGYKREEIIGHTGLELGIWLDSSERETLLGSVRSQGRTRDKEINFRTKSGETVTSLLSVELIELDGKQCLLVVGQDITERKRVEKALRKTEEQFNAILNYSPNLIFLKDVEGRYLLTNKEYEKAFHVNRDQIYGKKDIDIFPPDQAAVFHRSDLDVLQTGVPLEFEEVSIHNDGPHTSIVQKFPLFDTSGKIYAICGFVMDITERKRIEEELRCLSGRLLHLQDDERRTIARDLHDSTGQNLVALATMLGQLRSSVPSTERYSRRLISECKAFADRCIREVRTLSYLLHPPMLEEAGLEDAIRDYVMGFSKRSGIRVTLELSPRIGRLARDVELALFRVVQEGLTNIQRHSGSPQAKLRIDRNSNLTLEISDQGRGIPSSRRKGGGGPGFEYGVGIPSMQERVKLIGGQLELGSTSRGTSIRVTIPLGEVQT
jgi:PAS domain S-box-containing protein